MFGIVLLGWMDNFQETATVLFKVDKSRSGQGYNEILKMEKSGAYAQLQYKQ